MEENRIPLSWILTLVQRWETTWILKIILFARAKKRSVRWFWFREISHIFAWKFNTPHNLFWFVAYGYRSFCTNSAFNLLFIPQNSQIIVISALHYKNHYSIIIHLMHHHTQIKHRHGSLYVWPFCWRVQLHAKISLINSISSCVSSFPLPLSASLLRPTACVMLNVVWW